MIHTGTYKGYFSIIIESHLVRMEMVPGIGGKLVSIVYKPTGKEWLLDSGERPLKQPVYGSVFTEWDMSGWDECFPTIIPCVSETEGEVGLPDHGELWPLPWKYAMDERAVVCSVRSPRLPYRLTRRISFRSANRVRFDYRVENEGEREIPFLWVPHPQFAVTEPTRILLPPFVEEMLCVDGGKALQTGEKYEWNAISLISPVKTGDGRKFYYPGKVPVGWSGLHGLESGNYFILSVPVDTVPYVGVWMDEGMYNDRVTCTLEPSIGYYDSLETAIANGTARTVPSECSFEWNLELTLGNGNWQDAVAVDHSADRGACF